MYAVLCLFNVVSMSWGLCRLLGLRQIFLVGLFLFLVLGFVVVGGLAELGEYGEYVDALVLVYYSLLM